MHELSSLKRRLLKAGVAPKYATRTLTEIDCHVAELRKQGRDSGLSDKEARQQAWQQIGPEQLIVQEALSRPELLSWSRRYTKSVFLIAPLVLYFGFALVLVSLIAGVVPGVYGYDINTPWPRWYQAAVQASMFFVEYLLTPLVALLICVLAQRRNIQPLWPATGLALLAFIGSGWETTVRIPEETARGDISLHWGYAFMPWGVVQSYWDTTIEQFARMAFIAGMALFITKYYQPLDRKPD